MHTTTPATAHASDQADYKMGAEWHQNPMVTGNDTDLLWTYVSVKVDVFLGKVQTGNSFALCDLI